MIACRAASSANDRADAAPEISAARAASTNGSSNKPSSNFARSSRRTAASIAVCDTLP
jgi:hypothetical protein